MTEQSVFLTPPGGKNRYFSTRGVDAIKITWTEFQEKRSADGFSDGPHYDDPPFAYGTLRTGEGVWSKIGSSDVASKISEGSPYEY